MKYDVFGLGNPLIDVIIQTKASVLKELDLVKGSMNLVDVERQSLILEKHQGIKKTTALGGSCPNTMVTISQLGGKSALCGNIGSDDLGDDYEKKLIEAGVCSYLVRKEGPTGSTVILLSEDADRTMNTNLGMCQRFSKDDLDFDAIKSSSYLYVTGYQWDTPTQKEMVITALKFAKAEGIKIALSLSDSFCVEKHKRDFDTLLETYVDLLFCNQDEAAIMTGCKSINDQIASLSGKVKHVVVTMGSDGAEVINNETKIKLDALSVSAIDTTGAGDAFAAGYLYGITNGYPSQKAGSLASFCAATIVGQMGPIYQGDLREKVEKQLWPINHS